MVCHLVCMGSPETGSKTTLVFEVSVERAMLSLQLACKCGRHFTDLGLMSEHVPEVLGSV